MLLLHALKEVILHSPTEQLEGLADSLWAPLFAEDASSRQTAVSSSASPAEAAAAELGDDGVRNVKAACIGKLTTTAPAKFLPQLQVSYLARSGTTCARSCPGDGPQLIHLQSLLTSTPKNKALVAAAVRYSFIDTSSTHDELISPLIGDFLSLMRDENLVSDERRRACPTCRIEAIADAP